MYKLVILLYFLSWIDKQKLREMLLLNLIFIHEFLDTFLYIRYIYQTCQVTSNCKRKSDKCCLYLKAGKNWVTHSRIFFVGYHSVEIVQILFIAFRMSEWFHVNSSSDQISLTIHLIYLLPHSAKNTEIYPHNLFSQKFVKAKFLVNNLPGGRVNCYFVK